MKKFLAIVPFSVVGYNPDKPQLIVERELIYGELKYVPTIGDKPNDQWWLYRGISKEFVGFIGNIDGLLMEQSTDEFAGIAGISKQN